MNFFVTKCCTMNGWWNLHSSEKEKWFASAGKKTIKMQWRRKRRWSEANCLRLARKQFVTKHRALSAVICEELKASDHERFVIKIFKRLSGEKAPKVQQEMETPLIYFFHHLSDFFYGKGNSLSFLFDSRIVCCRRDCLCESFFARNLLIIGSLEVKEESQ